MPERALQFAIIAPAGFATNPAAVDRAVERLEARGHRVRVDPTARSRWQRFAASDDERLAALKRAADDPAVAVGLIVRGGHGFTRLDGRIDVDQLAAARTRWLGRQVATAFQLA